LFVIWPIYEKIPHWWFKPIPGQPVDLPINPRLSENAFLARHLDGKTQNQNKAINDNDFCSQP